MEGAREAKVPKFKRCKISRQQLVVLMQHFGEFNLLWQSQLKFVRYEQSSQARRPEDSSVSYASAVVWEG